MMIPRAVGNLNILSSMAFINNSFLFFQNIKESLNQRFYNVEVKRLMGPGFEINLVNGPNLNNVIRPTNNNIFGPTWVGSISAHNRTNPDTISEVYEASVGSNCSSINSAKSYIGT